MAAKKKAVKREPKTNTVPAGVGGCCGVTEEQRVFVANGPAYDVAQGLNDLLAQGWLIRSGDFASTAMSDRSMYLLYRFKETK